MAAAVAGGLLSTVPASTTTLASATVTELHTQGQPVSAQHRQPQVREPLIIAHRGASGYRPEHTLASYELAIQLGADYIEPDLVSTSDGFLVARHENEISGTTDVADRPEFADRQTTKIIDGRPFTGWFTEDFTLRELKTLRAVERLPDVRPDNTRYDGLYQVPTFQEVLRLVQRESRRRGIDIGVYPETKHPTYFDSIGLSLEEPLLRALRRHNLDRPNARVFIQSFETANLRELSRRTQVKLVQLLDLNGQPYDFTVAGDPRTYRDLVLPAGLREIARYADGIGPHKDHVIPRDPAGFLLEPSNVVRDAHRQDLLVHVFTLRDENQFLPADFRVGTDPNAKGNAFAEFCAFLNAGVDGMFTDYADTGVVGRDLWQDRRCRQVSAS